MDKTLEDYKTSYEEGINHHEVDCETTMEWFNDFCDYVENLDKNLYDEAIKYADNLKNGNNGRK